MLSAQPVNARVASKNPAASAPRTVLRAPGRTQRMAPAKAVAVEVMEEVALGPIDMVALNKRLEARSKALIALEEQEILSRPKVRVRIQKELALGEAWKVVGLLPEFGRFRPEVAPYMKWSNGHVWTYEGRVRPGTWKFKLVVRRPDGAYVWEEGQDRVLRVPRDAGPDTVIDIPINGVKLPQ